MTRRTDGTPFEEELVNAMNDLANSAAAPAFDSAGIARKTRRRRKTAIAGFAAALIVAGGGTAIATGGSDAPRTENVVPATSTPGSTYNPAATVVMEGSKYKYEFGGISLDFAQQRLAKMELKQGTVTKTDCGKNGKPGTVASVDPHEPTVVAKGATINLTLCAG
ncbi:PASTA domain-containing protein [Streptomyces sp. NPDC002680]|uniref:PASTA domain-containing protein n=1 Tax=Streptomyces sp. NPDC002680 TaxID=3364659 RepID=UPI00367CB798